MDRQRGFISPKVPVTRPDPAGNNKRKSVHYPLKYFQNLFQTVFLTLFPSFLIKTPYFPLPNSSDSLKLLILQNSQNPLLQKFYLVPICFFGRCSSRARRLLQRSLPHSLHYNLSFACQILFHTLLETKLRMLVLT